MYHFLHAGFYTPAVVWTTICGRNYIYTNNSLEARCNLWNYMMWEHIMEEIGERNRVKTMKFKCDNCGEVDHVLMDGYGVGDLLLEGVMFKITVKKEKFQETLIAKVDEQGSAYFKSQGINAKKWEKEMTDDARDSHENDGCCLMICPICNEDQVITIIEE